MTASAAEVVASVPTGLFIAGQWRESGDGGRLAVEDPTTGRTLATVADATVVDGEAALTAAHEAQAGWAAVPPRDRAELLRAAFELLTERYLETTYVGLAL